MSGLGVLTNEITLGLMRLCTRAYGSDVGRVGPSGPAEDEGLDVRRKVGQCQKLRDTLHHQKAPVQPVQLWSMQADISFSGYGCMASRS